MTKTPKIKSPRHKPSRMIDVQLPFDAAIWLVSFMHTLDTSPLLRWQVTSGLRQAIQTEAVAMDAREQNFADGEQVRRDLANHVAGERRRIERDQAHHEADKQRRTKKGTDKA